MTQEDIQKALELAKWWDKVCSARTVLLPTDEQERWLIARALIACREPVVIDCTHSHVWCDCQQVIVRNEKFCRHCGRPIQWK